MSLISLKMAEDASSSSDESIDVTSKTFDPIKALYSSKIKIPTTSAPVYDNISKFQSILKGTQAKADGKPKKIAKEEALKRRFLPHQEPVPGKTRDGTIKFNGKNVLSKMKSTFGPLSVLFECMETKTRVKVYTRSARGIRGHVEAYVAAFDKHWNLALEDCLEVWTRKVKRKAPALGLLPDLKLDVRDEDVSKVVVKESNEKMETLERHVPQLLLRGEQIVIIVKIN